MGNMGYGWTYVAALGACFWWSFVLGSLPSDQFCSSTSEGVEFGSCAPPKHNSPDLESSSHPSNTMTNDHYHLIDTQIPPPPGSYPTLNFTTQNDTAEDYYKFIENLRNNLTSGEEAHGIRMMRDISSVPDSKRFILVELSNSDGQQVTIAIDVVNASVVAYLAGDVAYFFDDSSEVAYSNLFTDAARRNLSFEGSYSNLENVAEQGRENISLGIWPLDGAIGNLSRFPEKSQDVAKALMVIIQMISEAARFNYIVLRVSNHTRGGGFTPDTHMLWLEDNWKYISKMIQKFATKEGIFLIPFRFRDVTGRWQEYCSVTPSLIVNMGLMLFICTHSQLCDINVCPIPEQTVRIIGRDLRCITVEDGRHSVVTALTLSSCRPDDANQLWTLKRDGTIQSNGKCMTAYGFSPQDYVIIQDCNTASAEATKWEVRIDGTIANPHSTLVLSANFCDNGTVLQVQQNHFNRSQGWRTTNTTKPPVTPILSVMLNLCLQETDGVIKLDTCDDQRIEQQQWVLYPDGSIRRRENEVWFLGFDSNNVVLLLPCEPADDLRRWVFKYDGSTNNLNRRLAMEVTGSNTVIVNQPNGALNQSWFIPL